MTLDNGEQSSFVRWSVRETSVDTAEIVSGSRLTHVAERLENMPRSRSIRSLEVRRE